MKTPRQVARAIDAHSFVIRGKHNERASLAWHIAALTRMSKMPKLQTMLLRESSVRITKTPEQLLAVVRTLNAMHGGKVIEG